MKGRVIKTGGLRMIDLKKGYTAIAALIFLSGCASSQYSVQFDSNPQGAMLVCDGKNWGYTPETLYLPKGNIKDQEVLNLSNCTANWASGAQSRYGTVNLSQFPDSVRVTARRPNVPGLDQDMSFALKIQQFRYQQQRDAEAANAQAWRDLNQSIRDATPRTTHTNCYGSFGSVNCTSRSN